MRTPRKWYCAVFLSAHNRRHGREESRRRARRGRYGLEYFGKLAPLLARLHDVGCERDKAGNRLLHFDQYCMLVLLFLFNPAVRSLRAIQQAGQLRNVQRKLGCLRASLGSLSEAKDVFQPERLKEIIAELGEQLQPIARDPRLKDVQHRLTLVDGTLMKGLPVLVQAALRDPRTAKLQAKFRLHTQFDLERGVPIRIDVTEGISRGEADERAVLARALETGRCYVKDRGYAKFKLFNEIVVAKSSYVCRLRDNSRYEIEEQRPLAAEDIEGGMILDAIVRIGEYKDAEDRPDHPLRLVVVKTTPHEKRGGPPSNGLLLIATDLLDLPAWIIALIYRYRWTIEVFFRFFKHVLGCRHLLSHDSVGIEIQTYCAIIGCRSKTPKHKCAVLYPCDRDGVCGCADVAFRHLHSAFRYTSTVLPPSRPAPAWHRTPAAQ